MNTEFQKSMSFLTSLVKSISLPVVVIGTDLRIRFVNPAAEILFAEKIKGSPVGENCYRFLHGHEAPCFTRGEGCPLIDCRETGGVVKSKYTMDDKGEFPRHYEIIAAPMRGDVGKMVGIVEVFNDITDWTLFEKWLKAAHQDSEHQFRERTAKLLEANKTLRLEIQERQRTEMELLQERKRSELLYRVIPSAIFTVDLDRHITSWNDKAAALTGYSREEIVGRPCSIFALYPCPGKCGMYTDSIEKPIVGRECVIRTKNGQTRIVSKNGDFLLDDDGNIIGAVESFEDITNIKKFEEELSGERDKLKGMLSAMNQSVHIVCPDYIIEYQNDDALQAFGDMLGQRCYKLYRGRSAPCEHCLMHAAIEEHSIQRIELLLGNNKSYAQSYTPFVDVDGQTKMLVLLRDITEEKLLQAETLRSVQLASVGELAAGVAHEINNPINGIINYAQIIQDESDSNETLTRICDKIIREGERVASIVSNLLSFARQQDDNFDKIRIEEVIFDAVDLIRHQLSKNCIILELKLADNLLPIFGHHQQLQQVFLNLFSNARYALNQRYPGKEPRKKIIVSGEVVTVEEEEYNRIIVKDLGTGIPDEIVAKIFEPFYSSKTSGEGTGLGLSISRDIIGKHGGRLEVKTVNGEYTSMIVDIPVLTEEELTGMGETPTERK
ncbi:MAG: PAS domain-containing protein [Desulfobulbus sp.]|nr:MAG: PAS domain-containing protein [Desulfobulbus sp.]